MKLKLEKKPARIELIPLIDIIFLLLVFFVYSMLSMVVFRGIPVDLPSAVSTGVEKGDMLVITIDDQGRIFMDKEKIAARDLLMHLKELSVAFPHKAVVIAGHKDSPYQVFVDVLDQVRMAGFQHVSIEAQPRDAE